MLKVDLHTHSTVSDGSASIGEIIDMAAQKGLQAIAITDHDTTSHFRQIPVRKKVFVICGTEISAMDQERGVKAHILGYNMQNPTLVEKLVRPLVKSRHATCLEQIEILKKRGFAIDLDDMRRADGKYIYKQHIMEYLARTGQVPEMFGEFYRAAFQKGGICAISMKHADVFEAVTTIAKAGGQAVLAHPGQQQNFYMIPALVRCGLKGIEYNHPSHGEADKKTIKRLAEEYGLFLTGGSDFHGCFQGRPAEVGGCISEESGAAALCRAGSLPAKPH